MADQSKPGSTTSAAAREYEDFDPPSEWVKEENHYNLLVYLPGFQKDRLKIQITSTAKLRVSGERPIGHNKWRHFVKEFPLEPDSNTNKISAKFEGGILYIKVPKIFPWPPVTNTADHPQPHKETKPKSEPTPRQAELVEPTKPKATTPLPSADDREQKAQPPAPVPAPAAAAAPAPPQQQQQQQEQQKQVAPLKPGVSTDKQQTGIKTRDIDQQVIAKADDQKKTTKEVPGTDHTKSGKASDKAEKITPPQQPPVSGDTKPEKKPIPDGPADHPAAKKDAEENKKSTDVVDRSAKSEGQKKTKVSGLLDLVKNPRALNVAVAVLVLVVLGLYAKNNFRFFERSNYSSAEL